MTKKTFSSLALFALAGCGGQAPPAEAPPAPAEPAPAAEAAPPAATTAAPVAKLPPATPDERAKIFQGCWASFNAKDWQKFPACYSETATAEQVDMMPAFNGRNDIVEKSVKGFASAFPDGNGENELTLVNGNNITTIVLFRGTHTGPLVGPMGTIPATNKKVGYMVGQTIELNEEGRAVQHERIYFDGGTMLGQLGLSPAPHRKLVEVGWPEKPVVLATNSEVEKANLVALQKGIETFNKHDITANLANWTDDCTFSDVAAPADTVGKPAMKKFLTDLFKAFPDVKIDVAHSWAAGDYVVHEGTLSGTNTGDWPTMKLKKTGKKVSLRYLEVDKIIGGKAKNAWLFDNGMSMAMQLGMVPPAGAKDSKPAPGAKDPKAAPAAKDPKAAPAAPAGKDSKATPAAPAAPAATAAKPASPTAPAATAAKPATPATPATPAAPAAGKPATPATPAKPATPAAPK